MARRASAKTKTPKAPKEKKQTPAKQAEARSNLTDDTTRELLYAAVALDKDVQIIAAELATARSAYSNHKKKAKKLGLEPDDVSWYVNQCKRDPEDIDRETRRRNHIARATGLPITAQLGLFDDGTTVATVIEEDRLASLPDHEKMTSEEAFSAGSAAYASGQSWEAVPFKEDSDARRASWLGGWDDAHFKSAEKITPLEQPAPHTDMPVDGDDEGTTVSEEEATVF